MSRAISQLDFDGEGGQPSVASSEIGARREGQTERQKTKSAKSEKSSSPTLSKQINKATSRKNNNSNGRKRKSSSPSSGNNRQQDAENSSNGRKKQQRTIEAERDINRAIDTVMEFNNARGRSHQDKWYIGIGSIRTLTGRGDKVIRRVLTLREDVERHHSSHRLDQSHNLKGRDATPIDEIIHLDRPDSQ